MTASPWLIAAPVALSVVYGMLRVNYLNFRGIYETRLDT